MCLPFLFLSSLPHLCPQLPNLSHVVTMRWIGFSSNKLCSRLPDCHRCSGNGTLTSTLSWGVCLLMAHHWFIRFLSLLSGSPRGWHQFLVRATVLCPNVTEEQKSAREKRENCGAQSLLLFGTCS